MFFKKVEKVAGSKCNQVIESWHTYSNNLRLIFKRLNICCTIILKIFWSVELKRGRRLFQRRRINSHKTSKLCNFLFENN